MKKIAVVGLGLIGGSMALELKSRLYKTTIIGVEKDLTHARQAVERELVHEILSLDEAVLQSDIIVLATPPDVTLQLLPQVLDQVNQQVVMDVASVKLPLERKAEGHPMRGRYIAAHPMAGTEYSGPEAALRGLFENKACIICHAQRTDESALDIGLGLIKLLNMRVAYMEAEPHDRHAAYVSHISHLSSFALALTVLDKEKSDHHIFDMAGGGFSSTVRLAKSNPSMWEPVFELNRDNVLDVLSNYIEQLEAFKQAIKDGDRKQVNALIYQSNKIKRVIK